MEITQQADYAVRAILDLALRPNGERASCEEIARRQGIPVAFLTKICARLAAEGLVQQSTRRKRRSLAGAPGPRDHAVGSGRSDRWADHVQSVQPPAQRM